MRFVFVVEGNGLPPDQIQPVGIERKKNAQSQNDVDRLVDAPLDNHELPEALKPLAFRNGTQVRADPDFHSDLNRLISGLKDHFEQA